MATSPKQKAKAPAAAAPVAVGSEVPPNRFPLFKGATRVATVPGGVPTRAFAGLVFVTVTAASFTLWGWLLFPVLYPVMAILSRHDDRAFWIWELWVKTKFLAKNKRFWGAISLTPTPYSRRRPWARWLGVHDR
ncbi:MULTISPECIES: type IV secretion system protein VirB3 [Achromobacter]|jgi:type IV secretion system protein VirB3|uniref:VirB3 family type IV secretion system protein n=1 Tax=Achromobacter spanius TaxID=217203 RepID=A0AA42LVQ2_9BURK|nr:MULTISPECIES: VirB3 family type IV secretion system protein [Achromobacter]MDH0740361.1 VirB3 family type IV secretion system protein [Achromobacter spanius]